MAAAVVLRLALHAVYLPAFEGPDEPHHLARVLAWASGPVASALSGAFVPAEIVAAVRAHPCGPAMAAAYGCRPFPDREAAFNLVRGTVRPIRGSAVGNPEANQPPLFYLLAGVPFRLADPPRPETLLLLVRLANVLLVGIAIFGPLRALAADRPPVFAALALLALLLPGAAESLARCSNDAAVFLWSALVLAALERRSRGPVLLLLLAAGPLLKLTAIPVVVLAVAVLVGERRVRLAIAGAGAACAVFAVQALRGWAWGGTVELNRATPPIGGSPGEFAIGLARSAYTFVKTTFWLGGWSFFRAPWPLVAAFGLLILAWAAAARRRPETGRALPHAAAAAAAFAGFLTFAIANRRLYGVWGGVGGWYAWAWWPWLVVAAADLTVIPPKAVRGLVAATAVFVVGANAAWFAAAAERYGSLAP